MKVINKFISWFTGEPVKYLECNKGGFGGRHPSYARVPRTKLWAEQSIIDAYEECTICGKEWHEDDV